MPNARGEITYIVTFELGANGSYTDIDRVLRGYGTYGKILENVWSISTLEKTREVLEKLSPYIGTGGSLFVVKSGSAASWKNVQASNEWLKKYLPN